MLYKMRVLTDRNWKLAIIPDTDAWVIDAYNLCTKLGFTGKFPWFVAQDSRRCYRQFFIDKLTKEVLQERVPGRSLREINAPAESLKSLHRSLVENIFSKLPKHEANFAYIEGKNIKHAGEVHKEACPDGKGVLIRVDLKDFFPSHTEWYVRNKLFEITGLPKEVCWFITKLVSLDGCLPQGAVTSPALSVALNYSIDTAISDLATKRGFVYTRYADDLCFSGPDRTNKLCWDFIREVAMLVQPFKVNWNKVEVMRNKNYSYLYKLRIPKEFLGRVPDEFLVVDKGDSIEVSKVGREEIYESELELMAIADVPHKKFRFYMQDIKRMLGMHLTGSEIHYPRAKYNKLRLEAMLVAKGATNVNQASFRGKVSHLKLVDPKKYNKIMEVIEKWRS